MKQIISEEYSGWLLRDYIRRVVKLSRKQLTRLKTFDEGIKINGRHENVNYVLSCGDEVEMHVSDREDDVKGNICPTEMELDILYEDDDIILVNKPSGMPTHPSHGHYSDTLANGLMYYFSCKGKPFVFRAVNRLDSDTSGVVLVAKNKFSAGFLSDEIMNKSIEKKYIAVCHGSLKKSSGSVIKNIRRERDSIITRVVCPDDEGDFARTDYSILSSSDVSSVYLVSPITGRTHQIRVHFAYKGCPLYGDKLYGIEDEFGRQALHAYELTFRHPSKKEMMTVKAPLKDDLIALISDLGMKVDL